MFMTAYALSDCTSGHASQIEGHLANDKAPVRRPPCDGSQHRVTAFDRQDTTLYVKIEHFPAIRYLLLFSKSILSLCPCTSVGARIS